MSVCENCPKWDERRDETGHSPSCPSVVRVFAELREPTGGGKVCIPIGDIEDMMLDGQYDTEEWGIRLVHMTLQQFKEMPEFDGF